MDIKYHVRFTGLLQTGMRHEDVVSNLVNLTNLEREKADALLSSGKPLVLKRDLDLETAEKYHMAFEKAGMEVLVERTEAMAPPPPQPTASKPGEMQQTPPPTGMTSPKIKQETNVHIYETPKSNLIIPRANTSGQGKGVEIPDGVKGWCWGGFLLNWIWAIGNKTWIGLFALIPYVGFIVAIVLGVNGRQWAWQNKEWQSVEHFQSVQKRWTFWGLILLILPVAGIIAAVLIPMFAQPR